MRIIMDRLDINNPNLPNLFNEWLVELGVPEELARTVDRVALGGVTLLEAVDEDNNIVWGEED